MKKLLLILSSMIILSGCKNIHGAFLAHYVTKDSGSTSISYTPFSSMESCQKNLLIVNQYGATGGDAQAISSFVCVETCNTIHTSCESF